MTNAAYKFHYEKWHQDTKESRNADIRWSTNFIDDHGMWPKLKNAHILDLGCGMGRFLLAFRENGYKNISGIDIDEYQVRIAKKEKLDIKLIDANKFFAATKKQFDLVTMIDCLEHIETSKQIELLKGIFKNLSNDGRLFVQVPNALSPTFSYHRYIDFTHELSYTTESLSFVLKNAGFSYIVFRPAWKETEEIIKLKSIHAQLLKAEFGIENPILTANLVAVAFKSKKDYESYLSSAPKMELKYERKMTWWDSLTNR